MSIPDKDTLMLFSKSAGLCNYCKVNIIEEHFDTLSNFGERAHILGKNKGSARYIEQHSNDNSYYNLILLCRKHHKLIDDHPEQYSAHLLLSIKSDHEMRIRQNPIIQSNADVAIIKSIFSIYNLMDIISFVRNQNLNKLYVDVVDILDIETCLLEYYQYDYPFKNPELKFQTENMFFNLTNLRNIFSDQSVFEVVTHVGNRPYFRIRSDCQNILAVQNAWKYFNLFRQALEIWYTLCKNNYGV